MAKNKICKICGENSIKRNVCKDCKEEFSYRPSVKGQIPFNRSFEKYKKSLKKK